MRVLDSEYKLKQNIRIAMLYLEDEDAVNAEAYIKKASSLIAGSKVRQVLGCCIQSCAVVEIAVEFVMRITVVTKLTC